MTERAKTLLIGCFIIIACLAMIGMLLFLRPSVGDGKKKLFVCFTSIEKVQIGTRVTFAGKPVGEVVAIDPIYDARSQPTGRSGHVCFYELELALDSHTVVYDTDEIVIHTTGLLGERTIAIVPKAVKKGQPSYPVTDQIMYGKSGDPVEETLNQIVTIGTKVGDVIDQLKEILQQNKDEIPLTLKAFRDASLQIKEGFETLNARHTFLTLNDAILSFQKAATAVTDAAQSFGDVAGAHKNQLSEIIQNLATFSRTINNPNSTLNRLLSQDDLYLQLTAVMTKADIIFDDINHYGILFHLDKSWQRERLRRLNLLNTLACPEAFSAYFDEEMKAIYLSLSRIEKSIERASSCKNRQALVHNKCFKEGFSELIARISNVEETLKIFRELVIEQNQCRPNGITSLFAP